MLHSQEQKVPDDSSVTLHRAMGQLPIPSPQWRNFKFRPPQVAGRGPPPTTGAPNPHLTQAHKINQHVKYS